MAKVDVDAKREYRATLLKLNARAWGIAVGVVFGLGLFFATLLLIIEGGHDVGTHLALLGKLLPGYRVTVGGAFIGFGYMFVIGYAVGRVIGIVYNSLARGD
jgi:tetrahydromethanopterin S-methyltransferase subunit G